jgi:glycine dehydrogenase
LRNAPHTADLLLGDWPYPYTKEQAFFPQQAVREDKYWPPVGRVDNVYGDRHVVCSCPPLEAYQPAAE